MSDSPICVPNKQAEQSEKANKIEGLMPEEDSSDSPVTEITIDEPPAASSPTIGADSEGCTTDADTLHCVDRCGGCMMTCEPAHKCPGCRANMHPWCGVAFGEEGYGQAIQCPPCRGVSMYLAVEQLSTSTSATSTSHRNIEQSTTSASAVTISVPNSSGISASALSPSLPNSSGATVSTSQSDTHTAVGIPSTPTLRTFQNLDLNLYEEGYDSDGQIGPHFDANIAEGPQIYDEDEIDEIMNAIPTEDDTPDEFVMIASEDILKLKVAELKVEIEKRGLVCSGLKKNLQEIPKKAMIDRTPY